MLEKDFISIEDFLELNKLHAKEVELDSERIKCVCLPDEWKCETSSQIRDDWHEEEEEEDEDEEE